MWKLSELWGGGGGGGAVYEIEDLEFCAKFCDK